MFAALFWLVYQALNGLIFLFGHLPPHWVHLDWPLRMLGLVCRALTFPRRILRHLWPSETSPAFVLWLLAALNWLLWGVLVEAMRSLRARRKS